MRVLASAVAAALLALPAQAQDALTEDAVRTFIDEAVADARKMVRAGDWAGILSWYETRLADSAQIVAHSAVQVKDGPTMTLSISMDAEDLRRFGGSMGAMPQGTAQNPIGEFDLQADLRDFMALPGGGASATVVFREIGTLTAPVVAQGSDAAGRQAAGEPAVFQTTSTCNLRLSPGEAESDMLIEMLACDSVSTLG